MGIATKNLAASGNKSLLGTRLRANCDRAGAQAAEEGSGGALDAPQEASAGAPGSAHHRRIAVRENRVELRRGHLAANVSNRSVASRRQ
jgi:hypothetical protein